MKATQIMGTRFGSPCVDMHLLWMPPWGVRDGAKTWSLPYAFGVAACINCVKKWSQIRDHILVPKLRPVLTKVHDVVPFLGPGNGPESGTTFWRTFATFLAAHARNLLDFAALPIERFCILCLL